MGEVVVVGLGQLGRLFGGGLLACGHTVVPVRRGERVPERAPELCLVAVGEAELAGVLASLPPSYRDRVALLQNELLPPDWRAHTIERPTCLVVWSEKKAGRPVAVVRETEIAGPDAELFARALAAVDVPARVLPERELAAALVVKNLYILVSNFAGLAGATSVGELLGPRAELASALGRDVLAIERARLGGGDELPSDEVLLTGMRAAFASDPAHGCRGRTAEARLARARDRARAAGLTTPALDRL